MKRARIQEVVSGMPQTGMAAVAGMIADPTEFPVVRKSGLYNTTPTAVAKPFIRQDITWNPSLVVEDPAASTLPPGDLGGFLFRNPMRAAVIWQQFAALQSYKYNWIFNLVPGEPGETSASSLEQVAIAEDKELFPVWAVNDPTNVINPHGPILFAGEDDGHRYIFVDGDQGGGAGCGQKFEVIFTTPTTVAASRKMRVYRYDSGIRRLIAQADSGAIGNTTFSLTLAHLPPVVDNMQTGYYGINIYNGEPTSGFFTFNTQSLLMRGSWQHFPLAQWVNQKAVATDLRVMAANVLLQNKSSELNKQGKVAICQARKTEDWVSAYATQNMYNNISLSPGAATFNWQDGCYGFLKPTQDDDMEYLKLFQTFGGLNAAANAFFIEDSAYALVQSDYLAFCISTTQAGAGDGVITISHAVEYRTRSMWQSLATPMTSEAEFAAGVQAIVSMEQFYENPVHWAKIFSTIGRIARVSSPILAAFGPYGKIASAITRMIGQNLK